MELSMVLKWVFVIVLVLVVVGLLLFGVVVVVWNDPGDPPPLEFPPVDPPVTKTPRGGEPVPRGGRRKILRLYGESDGGMEMEELLIGGVPLVALIVALVELAKQTMGLDSQFAPLTAVGLGIVLAVGIQVSELFPGFGTWFQVVILGMVAGLLACGIYSGVKATAGGGK